MLRPRRAVPQRRWTDNDDDEEDDDAVEEVVRGDDSDEGDDFEENDDDRKGRASSEDEGEEDDDVDDDDDEMDYEKGGGIAALSGETEDEEEDEEAGPAEEGDEGEGDEEEDDQAPVAEGDEPYEDNDDDEEDLRMAPRKPAAFGQERLHQVSPQQSVSLPPPAGQATGVANYSDVTRQYEAGGEDVQPYSDYMQDIMRLTGGFKRGKRGRGSRKQQQQQQEGPKAKKARKKGASGGRTMPESLQRTYGEAQRHYMRAEFAEALQFLNEIIRTAPNVPDAYQLMGQIYEDQGELKRAAEINLVGCQFGPKDAAWWKKTGQMFLELGHEYFQKAQYCFGRAIKINKKDIEAIADRAWVQCLWGRSEKAVLGYEQILRLNPPQPEPWLLRLADECFREMKLWDRGLHALSEVLCRSMGTLFVSKQIKWLPLKKKKDGSAYAPTKNTEFAFEAASLLCRHLMHPPLRRYDQAASVIQACHVFVAKLRERQTRFADAPEDSQLALPLDLVVRFGICQLYLQQLQHAVQCFAALKQRDASDPEVVTLLEDVACAFMETGKHFRALDMLRRLDIGAAAQVLSEPSGVRVKLRMARSYLALQQFKQAEAVLAEVQRICLSEEGEVKYPEALREAQVLYANTIRGLKDKDSMREQLQLLEDLLQQQVLKEPLPSVDSIRLPTLQQPRSRSSFFRVSGSAGYVDPTREGVGGGLLRHEAIDDGSAGSAMAATPEATRLELCLEYGLLCRELGRTYDFLSVCVALLEVVVHQSKNYFRRSTRKRLAILSLASAGAAGDEDEQHGAAAEEEEEEEEGTGRGGSKGGSPAALDAAARGEKAATGEPQMELSEKDPRLITELLARSWERTEMQIAVEAFLKERYQNIEVLPFLGVDKVFEAAKVVISTCIDSGMLKEATSLTRALIKRKKLLTDLQGKELQELVMAHAAHEDDYSAAVRAALVSVAEQPRSLVLCNSLNRVLRKTPMGDVMNRAIIRRLNYRTPDSVPLNMLAGIAFSLGRHYQMALDRYLAAYRHSPDDPLISLCIGALLVRVLTHRKMMDRHGCLTKAIAFLERYVQLRREQGPELATMTGGDPAAADEGGAGAAGGAGEVAARLAVEQETLYNVARGFHQAGLVHMAVPYYQEALQLYDEHADTVFKVSLERKSHVTQEAAYNLQSIYLAHGNRVAARSLCEKYLTLD